MLWQSAALPVQRIQPHCGHVFQEQPETDARAGQPPHHLLALLCRAGKAGSKAPQQQLSALWSLRDPLRRPTYALLADLMVVLLEQSEGAALKDLLANRCADPHRATGSQYCTLAAHSGRVSRVQPHGAHDTDVQAYDREAHLGISPQVCNLLAELMLALMERSEGPAGQQVSTPMCR